MNRSRAARLAPLVLIGALGGLLSGTFGIGGGVIMVPLIARLLGFSHRRAAATSLAAVFPAAVAGTVGYAIEEHVAWIGGLLIAGGGAVGALGGTWVLRRISSRTAQLLFIIAIVGIMVATAFEVPTRDADVELTLVTGAVALAIGVLMGFASGLLGIGGGVVAVPLLILVLGASDVLAKGTSLLAIVPTSLVGTLTNARAGLVSVRQGLTIGLAAAAASYPGVELAHFISPQTAVYSYLGLLVVILVMTLLTRRRDGRRPA